MFKKDSNFGGVPVEYNGKTYYLLMNIDHVDGPFQLEEPRFTDLKTVYPDLQVM